MSAADERPKPPALLDKVLNRTATLVSLLTALSGLAVAVVSRLAGVPVVFLVVGSAVVAGFVMVGWPRYRHLKRHGRTRPNAAECYDSSVPWAAPSTTQTFHLRDLGFLNLHDSGSDFEYREVAGYLAG